VAEDLIHFNIQQTYINGELMAENGKTFIQSVPVEPINQFDCDEITIEQLSIHQKDYPIENGLIPVIEALDGQLITNKLFCPPTIENEQFVSDIN
ncbi:hypothetical protein ACKI1Q_43860, partial [Streptomyces galilaeus]|uniref:hypothetical protein n=1 Tax=Streptomyces galilaeus TaxID=33899 RepID=UPI0038F7B361